MAIPPLRLGKSNMTARVKVTVKPKSSRREEKAVGGNPRVSVTVPPIEGKANEMCLALVADWLKVPKSGLSLLSGEHHKEKLIGIAGMQQEELARRLGQK
jgi:uncharacterized protein